MRLNSESTDTSRVHTIALDGTRLQIAQHALGLTIDVQSCPTGVDGVARAEHAHASISLPDAVRLTDALLAAIDQALDRDPRQSSLWGSTRRALTERLGHGVRRAA